MESNCGMGEYHMIGFIVGTMFGGCVGVVVMCLCRVASDADRQMEDEKHDG